VARLVTTPPALPTLLYDGHCRFCTTQTQRLARFLPAGKYQSLSFQDEGVLARFPGITYEDTMRALHYVDARGRVYAGVEAGVRALGLRLLGKLAYGYYIPGIRQLLDAIYPIIARNRYKLAGRTCDDGACAVHFEATRAKRSSPP